MWGRAAGLAALLLAAEPGAAQQMAPAPAADVATGIAPPPAGQGQIVFFRRGRHTDGYFATCPVNEQTGETVRPLFKLGKDKYVVLPASPGKHHYLTKAEVTDRLTLEVEVGETYFVKCELNIGGILRQPIDLTPANASDFVAMSRKLKPMTVKE